MHPCLVWMITNKNFNPPSLSRIVTVALAYMLVVASTITTENVSLDSATSSSRIVTDTLTTPISCSSY